MVVGRKRKAFHMRVVSIDTISFSERLNMSYQIAHLFFTSVYCGVHITDGHCLSSHFLFYALDVSYKDRDTLQFMLVFRLFYVQPCFLTNGVWRNLQRLFSFKLKSPRLLIINGFDDFTDKLITYNCIIIEGGTGSIPD